MAVNRHCIFTEHLGKDDPRKFSIATPAEGARAYKRVLEGCLKSSLIVRYHEKGWEAFQQVHMHEGALVPGLGDRRGRRGQSAADALVADGKVSSRNWGGPRQRDEKLQRELLENQWFHPSAQEAMAERTVAYGAKGIVKIEDLSEDDLEKKYAVIDEDLEDDIEVINLEADQDEFELDEVSTSEE